MEGFSAGVATDSESSSVAVIADIVGSRNHRDRAAAQRVLDVTIDRVVTDLDVAVEPFRPTVGDEQQAVYPTLHAALTSLLLLQLALPDEVDCRFGIGIGSVTRIPTRDVTIPEGPGWWAARAAINTAHAQQERHLHHARTRVAAGEGAGAEVHDVVSMANAYLLVRDELVGFMSARARRLTYGRLVGKTMSELAMAEGITQSAVSQMLRSSGATAIIASCRLIEP